ATPGPEDESPAPAVAADGSRPEQPAHPVEAAAEEPTPEPAGEDAGRVIAESEVVRPEEPVRPEAGEPETPAPQPVAAETSQASELVESRIESAAAGIAEVTPIAAVAPSSEPIDLKAVAASAGLQMVETSEEARLAEPEPIVVQPRKPRTRKPAPPVSGEPLEQVETRPGAGA